MRDGWVQPGQVFDGERLVAGPGLRIENGLVAEVGLAPAEAVALTGTVTPGYVDLQVNGGGGVLLNTDASVEGIATIAAAHRRFGTVAILPTLITDAPEVLDRTAEGILAARHLPGIIGLHIEGPHISLGRRGTHDPRYIRPLDQRTMDVVARLRAADLPVMITVAPEALVPGQIKALRAMGAVVSIGHSDTTSEQARVALAEGANCFTHLFNAMSPLLHRSPGVVGAALNSTVPAGIICDGIHVADELVGLAIRARPASDLMFLVSDAMPTVGGPDHFRLYDMELHVENGRLVNTEGSLAGAHVTMAESLARLIMVVGVAPEAALRMAVTIPAQVMAVPHLARLTGRPVEDVLLLGPDWTVTGTLAETSVAPAA